MKNFDEYIAKNPNLLDNPKKNYYQKSEIRTEQFNIALEKVQQGFPRKAVINWLIDECKWEIAYKTISDYIGEYVKEEN
tara:strand:- start:859 stop:1095 length:237 start_codon:yes stop_codon:yes gene_type:complete